MPKSSNTTKSTKTTVRSTAKRAAAALGKKAAAKAAPAKAAAKADGKRNVAKVVKAVKAVKASKRTVQRNHAGDKWIAAYQPERTVGELKKGSVGEKLIKLLRNANGLTDAQLSAKAGRTHAISAACAAAARAGLVVEKRRTDDGVVFRIKPSKR